ncbi:hypothetical protein M2404_001383 [Rheinheimera pacifica]|uniref:hypothetical protein n=1 Tax=Rheinheimera pacifica TaxID=173990 RepID=UPI002169CA74|nr:hypothetical protein [Rheinheimera pacifica]MCS4307058.1 hypothetical protein [Rheinheimera pacifica]
MPLDGFFPALPEITELPFLPSLKGLDMLPQHGGDPGGVGLFDLIDGRLRFFTPQDVL